MTSMRHSRAPRSTAGEQCAFRGPAQSANDDEALQAAEDRLTGGSGRFHFDRVHAVGGSRHRDGYRDPTPLACNASARARRLGCTRFVLRAVRGSGGSRRTCASDYRLYPNLDHRPRRFSPLFFIPAALVALCRRRLGRCVRQEVFDICAALADRSRHIASSDCMGRTGRDPGHEPAAQIVTCTTTAELRDRAWSASWFITGAAGLACSCWC